MLQLLLSGGILLGPMLSLPFSEREKLNFEDLPSLKESSFDDIFAEDTLSESHLKAHSLIDTGLKDFFKTKSLKVLPTIQHSLLDRMNRDMNTNYDTTKDDILAENITHDNSSLNCILNNDTLVESNSTTFKENDDRQSDMPDWEKIYSWWQNKRSKQRKYAVPDGRRDFDEPFETEGTSKRYIVVMMRLLIINVQKLKLMHLLRKSL